MLKRLFFFFSFAALFTACTPNLKPPQPDPGDADLSRISMVGGTYLSGYRDGALFRAGQETSVGYLFGQQLRLAQSGSFNMPWLDDPDGLGLNFKSGAEPFQWRGVFGVGEDCEGVSALTVLRDTFFGIDVANTRGVLSPISSADGIHNFAVPFARTSDLSSPSFGMPVSQGNSNPYYARFARNPGSSTVLGDVLDSDPTFFVLWTGMEDIYNYASRGGTGPAIPDAAVFRSQLDSALAFLTAGGTRGVLGNVPPLSALPYFTTVPPLGLDISQGLADTLNNFYSSYPFSFQAGENGFVIEDSSASGGIRLSNNDDYLLLNLPLDSVRCFFYGVLFQAVEDRYVLTPAEINEVEAAIMAYNGVIVDLAAKYDLPIADVNGLIAEVENTFTWNGVDFKPDFASGGFFSLDGINPTPKGAALMTNLFIEASNAHYNAGIPWVQVHEYDGIRFP